MNATSHFLSCDWGTTHFRLRLVKTDTLEVIQAWKSEAGVKTVHQWWQQQDELDQESFFRQFLQKQMDQSFDEPIVMSGMASSSIGLRELPYADFPIDPAGENLLWERVGDKMVLISGVKAENGMMRGEEVQAVGLAKEMGPEKATLILPGTHSKHLLWEEGAFRDMRNYMTGELFAVLTQHSILSASVRESEWGPKEEVAFQEGIELSKKGHLLGQLLQVRANDVIGGVSPQENYAFLSALLIGHELQEISPATKRIVVAATEPLLSLYQMGLRQQKANVEWVFIDEKGITHACLHTHRRILQRARLLE
ncbi:MAG: 2-dehydro-3-deoxygalactonokinase [Bacteroidota bacterium]